MTTEGWLDLAREFFCKDVGVSQDKLDNFNPSVEPEIHRLACAMQMTAKLARRMKPNPNCPLCQGLGSWTEGKPCPCVVYQTESELQAALRERMKNGR